jgi:hypothetical protein
MTKSGTCDALPHGGLFADLPLTPEAHFKIHFFGAVLGLIEQISAGVGSFAEAAQRFPFLAGYHNELARRLAGLSSAEAQARWQASLAVWEQSARLHLPLRALREALGVEPNALAWLMTIGLPEEDARFGDVFDLLQGGSGLRRPTVSLLGHCWKQFDPSADVSGWLARFREIGLVQVLNVDASRQEWVLQVPPMLWEALRGDSVSPANDWLRVRPAAALATLADLVVAPEVQRALQALPALLQSAQIRTIVIRGPRHNGRRTALGAVARALNRSLVDFRSDGKPDEQRWRQACALALLQPGLLAVECDPPPGETVALPEFQLPGVPVGIVMGRHGGLSGALAAHALTLHLGLPDLELRQRLWARCLPEEKAATDFAASFRLSTGAIQPVAQTARAQAAVAGRERIELTDVQQAARALSRRALDTLARFVPAEGDLSRLCAGERTWRELEHLERRCRHRERLPATMAHTPDSARNCGVRALLHGPSGTGKTLAARLLAATLSKDLYQLDLSAVINKYIGETEKNLNRVFDLAEEMDVVLLLDEGDALLTRRTDVQTANDRYANLETNFLLQRLESFEGIVLITTNTRDRIDPAFERRMDVVVEFLPPDAAERWQLWHGHLPTTRDVDEQLLSEVAGSCELSGGQIRNAAQHAALLALDNGGVVNSAYLEAAVRREYAKLGASCPLRL